MDEVESGAENKYYELLGAASHYAKPIDITSSGIWNPGDLTTGYDAIIGEPLDFPATMPTYRLNPEITVKSGDRVPQTGIYLPDVDHGFPTLLIKSDREMIGEANETVVEPPVGEGGYVSTVWTLVERISDSALLQSDRSNSIKFTGT